MTSERHQDETEDRGPDQSTTSPPDSKTHEATTPPGQGDRDDDATDAAEEKLEQAGGGH